MKKTVKNLLIAVMAASLMVQVALAVMQGQWPNSSAPADILVSGAANDQNAQQTALHSDGDFVVAWEDFRNGSETNIFAQKLNRADGSDVWTSGGLQVSAFAADDTLTSIDTDSLGNFYVVWMEGTQEVFAQKIDSTGTFLWGGGVNVTADDFTPDTGDFGIIVADEAGGAYVAWRGSDDTIYLTHIASSSSVDTNWNTGGTGTYRPLQLPVAGTNTPQFILRDSSGNIIVIYEGLSTDTDVYATKVSANGTIAAAPWDGPLLVAETIAALSSHVVPDGSDGFLLTYISSDNNDVKAQRVDSTGSLLWGPGSLGLVVRTSSFSGGMVSTFLTNDGSGGMVLLITEARSVLFLAAHHVTSSGVVDAAWEDTFGDYAVILNTSVNTGGEQYSVPIVSDGNNGAYAAYADSTSVFVQRIFSNATAGSPAQVGSVSAGDDFNATMSGDNAGGAAVIWQGDDAGGISDLYAQFFEDVFIGPCDTSPLDKIAFTSDRDGPSQIFLMDEDGSNQTNLTNNAADNFEPSFSPDGSKIAFQSGGIEVIQIINVDGSNLSQITNNPGDVEPSFSPDGGKIAFSRAVGQYEIFIINADGSGTPVNITSTSGVDLEAAFSPDGTKIVFSSDRDGGRDIFIMNSDGTGTPTNLTNSPTDDDTNPVFSPDGTKIAFSSNNDEAGGTADGEIFIMNINGSGLTNLTDNNTAEEDTPSFSPDGSKIAFSSNRDGNDEIYVMDVDGSSPTRLTNNSASDTEPSFGPASGSSEFCGTQTISASTLTFQDIPNSFSFGTISAGSSQNLFNNENPPGANQPASEDHLIIFDDRGSGGFTVTIDTEGPFTTGVETIPLTDLYVATSLDETDPGNNNGVTYGPGFTGDNNVSAPLYVDVDSASLTTASTYTSLAPASQFGGPPLVLLDGTLSSASGRNGLMSIFSNFHLHINPTQPEGSYTVVLTYTLADSTI